MAKIHLTDAGVKRLKPPQTGRIELFDTSFPAFGIRISQSGRRSWIFFYRYRGRLRRLTLGTYPTKTLAEARSAAHEAQKQLAQDVDPGDPKSALRAAEQAKRNDFEVVATLFLERYAKRKNRDWRKTEYVLRKEVIPCWQGVDVTKIVRRDVHDLLDAIVDRGAPIHANRTLAVIRKLFNWAVDRDLVSVSPAAGVKPPGKEQSRDRVLNDEELKALWEAADSIGYPFGPMYQLLVLTGQRLNEVARMQWTQVKGDTWSLPTTKNEEPHEVPLTRAALKILERLPKFTGPHVFTTTRGEKPVSGFSRAKQDIDRTSRVSDWHNHDIRRSVSTNFARLGIPPHVTEKVLNHKTGTISGIAKVYNRYAYDKEKRQALEAWARKLESIIEGRKSPT